jgi:hypothetical protein
MFKKRLFHRHFFTARIVRFGFDAMPVRRTRAPFEVVSEARHEGCGQAKNFFAAGVAEARVRALKRTHSTESAPSDSPAHGLKAPRDHRDARPASASCGP